MLACAGCVRVSNLAAHRVYERQSSAVSNFCCLTISNASVEAVAWPQCAVAWAEHLDMLCLKAGRSGTFVANTWAKLRFSPPETRFYSIFFGETLQLGCELWPLTPVFCGKSEAN